MKQYSGNGDVELSDQFVTDIGFTEKKSIKMCQYYQLNTRSFHTKLSTFLIKIV